MVTKEWNLAPESSEDLIQHLLNIRGIENKDDFLTPTYPKFEQIAKATGLKLSEIKKAVKIISEAIIAERPIVIHGDYDVDGICATAILWEALYFSLGYKNSHPFIPSRFDHGYGFSVKSLKEISATYDKPLIVTVDCGIIAVETVKTARELGIDVIITDHHTEGESLPESVAILHTKKLTGAGIAWVLAEALSTNNFGNLELVTLGTIADVQPLTGANRQLVVHGLKSLGQTERPGLTSLIQVASIGNRVLTPGIVGWFIAPRLNAAGRLEDAMESLRLLTLKSPQKAQEKAEYLHRINADRQDLTQSAIDEARSQITADLVQIMIGENWNEGIIGLIAGRLKDELYRPVIAMTAGSDGLLKASGRSIEGFDITENLRKNKSLLVEVGGHPMAAGFTIMPDKVGILRKKLNLQAKKIFGVDPVPKLKIDKELTLAQITPELFSQVSHLEPFGVGNPEPKFLSLKCLVTNLTVFGQNGDHLRFAIKQGDVTFPAIYFRPDPEHNLSDQGNFDFVYTIEIDNYGGRNELRLNILDFRVSK